MTAFGGSDSGRPLRIPTPGQVAGRAKLVAAAAPAPVLGVGRHDQAVYWAETGVGIAFEHAGCLDLLDRHYAWQLRVVDDVYREWEHKADQVRRPPGDWASSEEFAAYEKWCRVVAACGRLVRPDTTWSGRLVELPPGEVGEVRKLREELVEMPLADEPLRGDDEWTHRGECATVRAAQLLANQHGRDQASKTGAGSPRDVAGQAASLVQVLVTNDGKAMKLARRKGLATRTTAEVLREIVVADEEELSARDAWALHQRMDEVARIPRALRPHGPEFFTS